MKSLPFESTVCAGRRQAFPRILPALSLCLVSAVASAQDMHRHHQTAPGQAPPPFVASTAKSFSDLMGDAMAVMDYGMTQAPMTGGPDHDFVAMMIPHHQGAIDMAKALLLYGEDPELRNLAQGIITEQQNEIRLMQAWLRRKQEMPAGAGKLPQ